MPAGTLTINPVGLTITANNQSKAYGAALPALTVGYSGFVNGDTAASLTTAPAVTTTGTASSAAGTYPITASGAVDANYTISYVAGTLTVNPVGLTITANNQSKAYGAAMPALTVGYSGFVNGDTAASLTTPPAVTTTGTASSAVGTYPITASGAVDANYTISYVAGTLTINKAGLTVVAGDATRAYGQTNPVFTATYLGFVNGETNTVLDGALVVSTPAQTNSPVGLYPIIPSGVTSTNYAITYSNGTLTVTSYALSVTASPQSRSYGAANPGLTGSLVGLQNGDNISAAYATVADTNSPVGGYPITISLSDPDHKLANYAVTTNNGTLTVNPAGLTVTAQDKTKGYGAADPGFTVAYSGLVNGETSAVLGGTLTFSRVPGENVGSYAITPAGLTSTNYAITFASGTLTINPVGLTITANNQGKAYGAALPALTVGYSGFVNGDTAASLTTAPAVTTTGTASSAAGTYPITASGAVDANYTISYVAGTLTVNPVGLTITANNQSKVYGAALPALTVGYSGFVNGDTAASLTTPPAVTTTGTASSAAGTYPITASGAVDANYTISYVAGTLTINKAGLTVVAGDATRAYGQTNPVFTATYLGFVNGETNTVLDGALVVSTPAQTNSPVGLYPIIPSGVTSTNYAITYSNGTLTVTSYALSVTASPQSRSYGAANPGLTGSLVGLQNGDNISAAYATVADTNSPVGGYPITISLSDPDHKLANYAVTTNNGTLTVNPAGLTVTAQDQSEGVWGGGSWLHGGLLGPGERGDQRGSGRDADVQPGAGRECGQLCDHAGGADLDQLRDHVCQRDTDDQPGGADDHGQQPGQGLRGGIAGPDGGLQRFCQWGHGGEPDDCAGGDDDRDGEQRGGDLPDHGQRGGGCQLHDQLRGGHADGQPGGVDDHGQQPEQGLRGSPAGPDGGLQRLCQWGHGGEPDDPAGGDDDRDGEQRGGDLSDHGQRGGGCQLHDQLRGRHPDD